MGEISQVRKIFRAYFTSDTVAKEVQEYRLNQCNTCKYNSKNKNTFTALSPVDFCTICKCPIKIKTNSPYEDCPAYLEGDEQKWFKKIIKTRGEMDLNLTNVTNKEVKIEEIENNVFSVDLGDVVTNNLQEIDLVISSDKEKLKILRVNTTCGCTTTGVNQVTDTSVLINVTFNPAGQTQGYLTKPIEFIYTNGEVQGVGRIIIKAFKLYI